jgi:uncharacterized protein YdiU (UPF0061 family)
MPTESINPAIAAGWNFDNSYAQLPEAFRAEQPPVPVKAPRLVVFNAALAARLGLDEKALVGPEGAAIFAGNQLPGGAQPIAQAYAGHQFGYFTMLGDGRAILLGEQITPGGERFDIQLKGSGQTPFSRRGDGRASLGPMLREYIISEALHALCVPTTRSLAVVLTGEPVYRETPLPGAILTRGAASHLRVGTFEYAAAQREEDLLKTLADYALQRHFPELQEAENPYLALLQEVMERQAFLVAQWMAVGFIHGVMNTDNMTIVGETIDYGPCAFMDAYDPGTVFSSIDTQGRYAFGNQPPIAHWNLVRFAETLIPLLHEEQEKAIAMAQEALGTFAATYRRYWLAAMRAKLGLFTEEITDPALFKSLLDWMQQNGADYTNTFRALAAEALPDEPLYQQEAFQQWHERWQLRLARQPQPLEEARQLMRQHNPAIIPRNHRVEEALEAAVTKGDFSVLQRLLQALARPYEDLPEYADYRQPAAPGEGVYQTFCGT